MNGSYRLIKIIQRVNTEGETKEELRNKDRNFSASLVFCVITLEPIMIQTGSAPQNDSLNLSFVKDKHVVGKTCPGMVVAWPFISCYFLGVCRTCTGPQATS